MLIRQQNNHMKKIIFIVYALLFFNSTKADDLTSKEYVVSECVPSWPNDEAQVRRFLISYGIPLKEDHSIRYLASNKYIIIKTTPDNHQIIAGIIDDSKSLATVKKAIKKLLATNENAQNDELILRELMVIKPGLALIEARKRTLNELNALKAEKPNDVRIPYLEQEITRLNLALSEAVKIQQNALRLFDEVLSDIKIEPSSSK